MRFRFEHDLSLARRIKTKKSQKNPVVCSGKASLFSFAIRKVKQAPKNNYEYEDRTEIELLLIAIRTHHPE